MTIRDNFSAKTLRTLAARVAYHCSNPSCVGSTSGPALDEEHSINIGVGAHVAAAAPGGKRYDPNMTSAERSCGANGIWLCQSCSKLIDSDDDRFTVELLYQWKNGAMQRALNAIAGGRPLGPLKPPSSLDAADERFLHGLDIPSAAAVDVAGEQLRAATQIDIAAFRAVRGQPGRTIALTLRLEGECPCHVALESLSRLTALAEPVTLVASAGKGKSTTLLRLADWMGGNDGQIPLLVPLGEWSNRQDDFFDFILRRNAFGTFRRQHLMALGYRGQLALLLDGWNELTPEARRRATSDLEALQRDYPQLGLVISSRRQSLPTNGPVVGIEALSEAQQMELARMVRGQEGCDLVDRAWRTRGFRELISNPLYLHALLTLPPGVAFPETKEAVLGMFVRHNETAPVQVERLQRDTLGQHTILLTALAVKANRSANTVLSDADANRTVSAILWRLSEDGQIGAPPHPRDVVDGLVNAHLLVRMGDGNGPVGFQHQLFQEWYAAAEVEDLMLKMAAGDADAIKKLREDVLDRPNWEESILFSCDRLCRAGAVGGRAVAAAVDEALSIDPLLSAAMLDRAAAVVWELLRDRILLFIGRWHTPGAFDRAVRFMVASGKPEFAESIWPLASNAEDQIQYEIFRAVDRFHLGVLGPDRKARLRALPAPQRRVALSEIASNSGFDGMELATALAATDPDPQVVVDVVGSLAFRGSDRHVNQIMTAAPDSVWKALAEQNYPDHLIDAKLDARLTIEREQARCEDNHPARLLGWIVDEKPADAEARIAQLLGKPALDPNDRSLESAVTQAYPEYPRAVAAGLVARIAANLPLPYRVGDYLEYAPVLDSGPVADAVLDPSTPDARLNAAAAVVGTATVAALLEQLFAIDSQIQALGSYDKQLSDAHHRLVHALSATRQDAFVPALIANARTSDPQRIGLLADVLARYRDHSDNSNPPFDISHQTGLRDVVEDWIDTLRSAQQPARSEAANVARAAARLADASLAEPLLGLLERDLADFETARAARLAGTSKRGVMEMGYTLMYARAFEVMHDAPAVAVLTRGLSDFRWGIEAGAALVKIWLADHPTQGNPTFGGGAQYANHLSRRAERAAGTPSTSDFAEAIFDVVRTLGNAGRTDAEQRHALNLVVAGLALPHGAKRPEIDALLALHQPIALKHRLLVAAALAGEIIPAALLMDGLREMLASAEKQPWRLEANRGELTGWIKLFPFSDDPQGVHDAIALLPEQQRPLALRSLLEALPQGPADNALITLERLAANDATILSDYEWTNAVLSLDTQASALALLDHLCQGQISVGDGFRLSKALTSWANKFTTVRSAIIERYRGLPPAGIRLVLEKAMDGMADEEVFMALFDVQAGAPHAFRAMSRVTRNLALGRSPSNEWAGAFEEHSLPLPGLRAKLFAILPENNARAQLAKQCLIAIDELRDETGRVSSEPRHPDIATGRAWPPEADESH
jgi:hypothetical protein